MRQIVPEMVKIKPIAWPFTFECEKIWGIVLSIQRAIRENYKKKKPHEQSSNYLIIKVKPFILHKTRKQNVKYCTHSSSEYEAKKKTKTNELTSSQIENSKYTNKYAENQLGGRHKELQGEKERKQNNSVKMKLLTSVNLLSYCTNKPLIRLAALPTRGRIKAKLSLYTSKVNLQS
jgi:hypothetical protein